MARVNAKMSNVSKIETFFDETSVEPELINPLLASIDSSLLKQKIKAKSIVTRPNLGIDDMRKVLPK